MKSITLAVCLALQACCSEAPAVPSDCVTETAGGIEAIDETQCAWFGSSTETGVVEILYPREGDSCPISCGWTGPVAPYSDTLSFPCPTGVELFVPLGDGGSAIVCP